MKRIKDPIHNYILLNDFFLDLLDSPPMQRLRSIKQLGMANLVYPGANHTRFEHSLGTYHLAKLFAKSQDLKKEGEFVTASLLHDIGHCPFSHAYESTIKRYGKSHVDLTCDKIEKSSLKDRIEKNGLDVKEITSIIRGEGSIGCLLSGSIDVDRLDYIMRDSYYTGASFGYIDVGRLLTNLNVKNNKVIVEENCISTVEAILVARALMYQTVYYHHTVSIANAMLRTALEQEIEKGSLKIGELINMDDASLTSFLRKEKNELWGRIEKRNLYKTAFEYREKSGIEQQRMAKRAGEMDLGKEVIIDVIEPPIWVEMDVDVLTRDGRIERIRDISTLAKALLKAQKDYYRVVVYTTKKKRSEVGKMARKLVEDIC